MNGLESEQLEQKFWQQKNFFYILGGLILFLVVIILIVYFFSRSSVDELSKEESPILNKNETTQNLGGQSDKIVINSNINQNINTTPKTEERSGTAKYFPDENSAEENLEDNSWEGVDSDQDGLPDEKEPMYGTDPGNPDTDGDGYLDGEEIKNGYNPLGAGKSFKLFIVR